MWHSNVHDLLLLPTDTNSGPQGIPQGIVKYRVICFPKPKPPHHTTHKLALSVPGDDSNHNYI